MVATLIFPICLGVFFLSAAVWGLTAERQRKPTNVFHKNDVDHSNVLALMLIFALVWLGLFTNRALREVRLHSELQELRPESVERIEIGRQAVTDRAQIAVIVAALNRPQWYSLRRGDAADQLPFVIKLAGGGEYSYQIRRFLRGEGAALVWHSDAGWDNGEVFCQRLPASLARAGVSLPACSTYFGKPRHCTTP